MNYIVLLFSRDSDILLGTKPKKRKYRKTSGEESSSSVDTISVKRERSKKKVRFL